MTLPDLKELQKLIQLCRKTGIKTVKLGELELTLADEAPVSKPRGKAAKKQEEEAKPGVYDSWEALSDEDKLFYSSTGQVSQPKQAPDEGNA